MPMTPFDRKVELLRNRVPQAEIARRTGHSEAYVSEVIRGTRRSERIEAAVAAALGLPVAEVFEPRETDRPLMAAAS